jgi:hypothetical protein
MKTKKTKTNAFQNNSRNQRRMKKGQMGKQSSDDFVVLYNLSGIISIKMAMMLALLFTTHPQFAICKITRKTMSYCNNLRRF